MINTNILNEQRVNVNTCLLVQNVLLHGFVNFFSGHFVLEITTNGFVDFVHVGAHVLTGEDGRCAEDTHGLSPVVISISRVSAGTRVESVVNGEVSYLVVSLNGFTGHTVEVLYVVLVKLNEVIIEVVNGRLGIGFKRLAQQLSCHGDTGVGPVNGCGSRIVFLEKVSGVPVIAKNSVTGFSNGIGTRSDVVLERGVSIDLRCEIGPQTCGREIRCTVQLSAVTVNSVDGLRVIKHTGYIWVTFCHHDVSVRFQNLERVVQHEINHRGRGSGLDGEEVFELIFCEVVLHHKLKPICETIYLTVRRGVRAVSLRKLPNPHGRQIFLRASHQHVPSGWNTGLEVVRNRRMLAGVQCLEPVVPPGNKRRTLRIRFIEVLLGKPFVGRVPTVVVER